MSTIKVVDYDPAWPGLFERDKSRILTLIGDMVNDIHHIGSTSVVGLPAKPKIDIDAVLLSETLVPAAVERVKSLAEFTFHGDPYGDGMWTFTSGHRSYGTRLYLCGPGNVTHDNRVLFRDWLRTHPDAAAAYAALKGKLAAEADGDWKFYTGGKSDFVARTVRQASTERVRRIALRMERAGHAAPC
ncbi:GrpB family protein [Pararhizobium sp. A13]|uniref:GrpB family protein n=1 Tax=Pararhizobium sp. A13 TaxID=3133975 RepID=UPI00324A8E44